MTAKDCQNEIASRLAAIENRQRILADAVNEQTAEIGEVLRLVTELHEADNKRAAKVDARLHYLECMCGAAE